MSNCFSAAPENAATPPNKRVNYVSGMVLGKEDFFQEQRHFEWKSRLANHLPHGYGIICGLAVVTDNITDDVRVKIEPGYAISPKGNWLWVEEELCAPIGKWLDTNLKDLADKTDGPKTVFVRLCYRECEKDAVPIAVNACASSEDSTAPSRILETVCADLVWVAPTLPEFPVTHTEAVALSAYPKTAGLEKDPEAVALAKHSASAQIHTEMRQWVTAKRALAANGGCLPQDAREDCLLLAKVTVALKGGAWDKTVAITYTQADVPILMDTTLLQEWLAELQAKAVKRGDAAGGDLRGTYPNPIVLTSEGHPIVTFVTLAGGDLTGTYPNPTIQVGAVTTPKLADGAVTAPKG